MQTQIFDIQKINFRGEGIAFDGDHHAVRISNALPGERVRAVDASTERRRQACLAEIVVRSPDRTDPVCDQWLRCGMCQFQCLGCGAQTALKRDNWMRLIRKFIDIPEDCAVDFIPAAQKIAYRHRTEAVVFDRCLGILPRGDFLTLESAGGGAPSLIAMKSCMLHAPEVNRLIGEVQALLPVIGMPCGTRLSFEASDAVRLPDSARNARIIVLSVPELSARARNAAQKLAQKIGISLIFQELPPHGSHVWPKPESLGGSPWYCYDRDLNGDLLCALKGAWTPVNPVNAHMIRDTLDAWTEGRHFGRVLELGCGCGTHTAVFRGKCDHYTGIDASWPAILSAQHNAESGHWQNVDFYTDTAEHYLDKRYFRGVRADTILMHSSRMPYSLKTAEMCRRFGAKSVYVVGPTAYALARECRHFMSLGYRLCALRLCDTLPLTYHMMGTAHLEQ